MKPLHPPPRQQSGYILVLVLIAITMAAGFLVSSLTDFKSFLERKEQSQNVLAQAKEALIAYAVTYRERHPAPGPAYTDVYGFLPCPDLNNDGDEEPTCGAADVSVIGRLPWRTLGIPPLRDSSGECLWYAVSGHGKYKPPPLPAAMNFGMNWDAVGQFNLWNTANTLLAGSTAALPSGDIAWHNRPLAVVFAANAPLAGQTNRSNIGTNECGGNNTIAQYLDARSDPNHPDAIYSGGAPVANAASNLTITASSITNYNNDQALTLGTDELFKRIKKHPAFKIDIDRLLNKYADCLNNLNVASLPASSTTNKGIDNLLGACPASKFSDRENNVIGHWRSNLLYAKPITSITVNGIPGCSAVLLFGGERTTTQNRATPTEIAKGINYLEGSNASFPTATSYAGNTGFDYTNPSADLARCIVGLPPGATQKSFASDIASTDLAVKGSAIPPGTNIQILPDGTRIRTQLDGTITTTKQDGSTVASVTYKGTTVNLQEQTISIKGNGTATGECVWIPGQLPLAGKTLRAIFRFQFSTCDAPLTSNGPNCVPTTPPDPSPSSDRGYGFTFELVRSDMGSPNAYCGQTRDMGALALASSGIGGTIGMTSIIFEHDVHHDQSNTTPSLDDNDPVGNHIATMFNGNLDHSATNGNTTTACDGTAAGCSWPLTYAMEEAPVPTLHTERVEIKTGCNSTCSSCTPTLHTAPNNYMRIRTWLDCTDCFDLTQDLPVSLFAHPSTEACKQLDPNLNTPYFGFTGGFLSGASTSQGVTIQDFVVRTD